MFCSSSRTNAQEWQNFLSRSTKAVCRRANPVFRSDSSLFRFVNYFTTKIMFRFADALFRLAKQCSGMARFCADQRKSSFRSAKTLFNRANPLSNVCTIFVFTPANQCSGMPMPCSCSPTMVRNGKFLSGQCRIPFKSTQALFRRAKSFVQICICFYINKQMFNSAHALYRLAKQCSAMATFCSAKKHS